MIDFHTHILPGIDDGSRSTEESLRMLQTETEQGITEVIACIKAVQTGILPVNIGMDEQDEECTANIVTKENCRQDIEAAMSNAFGFGGQNSSIIVGKFKQ